MGFSVRTKLNDHIKLILKVVLCKYEERIRPVSACLNIIKTAASIKSVFIYNIYYIKFIHESIGPYGYFKFSVQKMLVSQIASK